MAQISMMRMSTPSLNGLMVPFSGGKTLFALGITGIRLKPPKRHERFLPRSTLELFLSILMIEVTPD